MDALPSADRRAGRAGVARARRGVEPNDPILGIGDRGAGPGVEPLGERAPLLFASDGAPAALLVATTILGDDPNDLAAVRRLRGVGWRRRRVRPGARRGVRVAAVGPFDELARWAMRAGSEETAQSPSVHEADRRRSRGDAVERRLFLPWLGSFGVVIAGVARRAGAHRCALALALSLVLPSPALILAARAGEHAYSADPVARLVLEAERGGEPIVMHGPFLQNPTFRAAPPRGPPGMRTYAEFGHEIEAPEASEHPLPGSNDALAVFAREHPDAIWVSEESHFHRPLAQILRFPLERLGSACGLRRVAPQNEVSFAAFSPTRHGAWIR